MIRYIKTHLTWWLNINYHVDNKSSDVDSSGNRKHFSEMQQNPLELFELTIVVNDFSAVKFITLLFLDIRFSLENGVFLSWILSSGLCCGGICPAGGATSHMKITSTDQAY